MKHQHTQKFLALTLALLALSVSSCSGKPLKVPLVRTETVIEKVPTLVPLPENLTADCVIPAFPDLYQVADANQLTAALYSALYLCNADKQAIRELQPEI